MEPSPLMLIDKSGTSLNWVAIWSYAGSLVVSLAIWAALVSAVERLIR